MGKADVPCLFVDWISGLIIGRFSVIIRQTAGGYPEDIHHSSLPFLLSLFPVKYVLHMFII